MKLKASAPPSQGTSDSGPRVMASAVWVMAGGVCLVSWQPTQELRSPGWKVAQLRMVCTACPLASSAWK